MTKLDWKQKNIEHGSWMGNDCKHDFICRLGQPNEFLKTECVT